MILDDLSDKFDYAVCKRGANYAAGGRVSFLSKSGYGFRAMVRGMRIYEVNVSFDQSMNLKNWFCTCPYFRDRGPCKHIWASLVQAQGFLNKTDPFAFEDSEEEIELLGNDFELPEELEPEPLYKRSQWRQAIEQISRRAAVKQHYPRKGGEQDSTIFYQIDKQQILNDHNIIVQLKTIGRQKNNTVCHKSVRLDLNDLQSIPDETDRQILAMLKGASIDQSYSYSAYNFSSIRISHKMLGSILPVLINSGRLLFSNGQITPSEPVKMGNRIWRLGLDIEKNNEAPEYKIIGLVESGDKKVPLDVPDVLLLCGWMFMDNTAWRVSYNNAFQWVLYLRKNGELRIPAQEIDECLQIFLNTPHPNVTFPEELHITEESGNPEPKFELHFPKNEEMQGFAGTVVRFKYADFEVAPFDKLQSFYDSKGKRVVWRDFQEEEKRLEYLRSMPLQKPRNKATWLYNEDIIGEIKAQHIPDTVRLLVEAGWEVYAEGKPYKKTSSIQINVSSNTDWFDLGGVVEFGRDKVPMPDILKKIKAGKRMLKLSDGSIGILPEDLLKRLNLIAGTGQINKRSIRFGKSQIFLLDSMLAGESGVSWDETSEKLRTQLRNFSGAKPLNEPAGFTGILRDYQREGMGWFVFLQQFGFGGCLADDMGLGKTVQVLALLEARRKTKKGASLVVAPSSVVSNWIAEAKRFVPDLRSVNHTGPNRGKTESDMQEGNLFVTSYSTLRRDIEWLRNIDFDYLILDEAQAIKNAQTATAKAARLLKGSHRLALSGTPIENHLGELWSLFEFLNPGMLGASSAFEKALSLKGLDVDEDTSTFICRAIRPFMMRRTKEQVAKELPEKHEETVFCEMTSSQRKMYDQMREYYRQQLTQKIDADGLKKTKIMVLEALLRLRQTACHPGLVDSSKISRSSGKIDLLMDQITDIAEEGHKVLVFSQFTKLLALVRKKLEKQKVVYEYLDGRTRNRASRVERFQTDACCPVFLISLKAGGTGLNLTAADYVILLDPWWNPAVEAQAIDRTHRIGQIRKVFAYRLVAKNTVEERILELQARKQKLADSIIKADENLLRSLTQNDLELLLS